MRVVTDHRRDDVLARSSQLLGHSERGYAGGGRPRKAGGVFVLTDEGAVDPHLQESCAAAAIMNRQAIRGGGSGISAAIPDISMMEAIVVHAQYRLAAGRLRRSVGPHASGRRPRGIIEFRIRFGRFAVIAPR